VLSVSLVAYSAEAVPALILHCACKRGDNKCARSSSQCRAGSCYAAYSEPQTERQQAVSCQHSLTSCSYDADVYGESHNLIIEREEQDHRFRPAESS
jgi:hypothetical protein